MKKNIARILIALLFIPLSVCNSQCYELFWSEEFNYTGFPDQDIWTYEVGGGGWGNNELQYYTEFDADNAWVENGVLTIKAIKENFGGREYTSARLITKDKFEYRYGRLDARIKMAYGQGIWPAFWTMGENFSDVGWPACGEIDIAEFTGGTATDNRIIANPIWDHNGSYASYPGNVYLESGIFADDFHIFSLEWTTTSLRWYLDGVQFHVMTITDPALSEFHKDFFILLNMAVGGNLPGAPDGTTVFPQAMEVDYVRLYKQDSPPLIMGNSTVAERSSMLKYLLPWSDSWVYNWTIPEDAELLSGQGTNEIVLDWGCADGELHCELSADCGTYDISLPVEVQNQISGPMFVEPEESGVIFTIPQQAGTSYNWVFPEDAVLVEGQGTDTLKVDWGNIFSKVSLTLENSCGTSELNYNILEYGQYPYPDPYTPHSIPGKIEATDFDYGGEGVAYHDNTEANEGGGRRPDERVDTQASDNGNPNVGWVLAGEWLEYSIAVQDSGLYDVKLRVATDYASGGPFTFHVNGSQRSNPIPVPGTGGWGNFISLNAGTLLLDITDTILKVNFNSGNLNLGLMTFTKSTAKPVGVGEYEKNIDIYPNPATEYLHFGQTNEPFKYSVSSSNGKIMAEGDSGSIFKTGYLDLSGFEPGLYILYLRYETGQIRSEKFIKTK